MICVYSMVTILFFGFGTLAGLVTSDLEIPPRISRFLSLQLHMTIGDEMPASSDFMVAQQLRSGNCANSSRGLRDFAVLDSGIWQQTLMLSAAALALDTCAQGSLATWGGSLRAAFEVPEACKLVCGRATGYASGHPTNRTTPGQPDPRLLQPAPKRA